MRDKRVIRAATSSDASCLAILAVQTWLHTYATCGIRPAIARYVLEQLTPEVFASRMMQAGTVILLAEAAGHLVGYGIVELQTLCSVPCAASSHLDKLFVQEHCLGRGIGYDLLTACRLAAQRRTGSSALWLTVNSGNVQAHAFYQRQGFENIGVTQFDLYGERHENRVLHVPDT